MYKYISCALVILALTLMGSNLTNAERKLAQEGEDMLEIKDNKLLYEYNGEIYTLEKNIGDSWEGIVDIAKNGDKIAYIIKEDINITFVKYFDVNSSKTKEPIIIRSIIEDAHGGEYVENIEFSPNDKYLLIHTFTDGIGINTSTVDSTENIYNDSIKIISSMEDYINKENIVILNQDNFGFIFLNSINWHEEDSISYVTNFVNEEKWELNLKTGKIKQLEGINLVNSIFSDIEKTNEDYGYVLRAKAEGWLDGYPDGTVKMDQPIKRAEFVKILIRSFQNIEEEVIPEDIKAVCPDVPIDQWYSRAFYTARELKVVQGYPEEGKGKSEWLCKPAQTINRVEALKVVLELAKFNTKNAVLKKQYKDTGIYEWYSPYTAYARTENLIKTTDSKLHPANPLTRGEMIVLTIKVKDLLGVDDEDWGKW